MCRNGGSMVGITSHYRIIVIVCLGMRRASIEPEARTTHRAGH